MQNQITFEFEGAKYTLAFTRRTVQTLSREGFKPEMVSDQPSIGIPMLFRGAFMVNHRNIKSDLTDKIWDCMLNKTELISKLLELYVQPINEMLAEPEEDESKKVMWEANC